MPTRHVLRVLTFCLCVILAPLGSIAVAAQVAETSSQSAAPSSTASGPAAASGPEHQASVAPVPAAPMVTPPGPRYIPVRTSRPARGVAFTSAVVRTALRFLNRPYQWSGVGDHGFDCSGLVFRVFAATGLVLPHSSFSQYHAGVPVPLSSLSPGDLVFFRTYNAGPSHVGIYVGADRFIHASYSRGVVISSMHEPYYRYRYLGARRL